MSATQRDIMAGIINAAMEEWDDAKPGTFAYHMAGHVADRLSAAGFGPVQEAQREAWELCINHVLASCAYVTSNAEPWRHKRLISDLHEVKDANPYRRASDDGS